STRRSQRMGPGLSSWHAGDGEQHHSYRSSRGSGSHRFGRSAGAGGFPLNRASRFAFERRLRMNLFLGTWVANLEKSRRHANHQFQSATLAFDVSGDVVSLTHAGVNMAGKPESGT